MSETFLDGKVTVSSLAAPSAEDLKILRALSEDERRTVIEEARERGRQSPPGSRTPDDIWESALTKARSIKTTADHAL